jgi:nicotinamidase-related amidase
MPMPTLLDRREAAVLLIDLQESYRKFLFEWEGVERACLLAVRGASLLGMPVLVTEQYPRGLGHTSPSVAAQLPDGTAILEKQTMSCCGAPGFRDLLRSLGRRQVLVTGIETHACVSQTVHELLADGYEVHVARDATSSRQERFVTPAWERMRAVGAYATTVEQALLEAVRSAEAPEFRALQQLFKEAAA